MSEFGLTFHLFVSIGSLLMALWLSRGPFYVPTRRKYVPKLIAVLDPRAGEKIADLGSGDGRLLVALGKAGAEAYGYEHNPLLVFKARNNIRRSGLKNVFVEFKDFWSADLSSFDAVIIYGIPYIMARLEKKLMFELKEGARVVAFSFPFPNWKPLKKEKLIYLYVKTRCFGTGDVK